MDTIDTTGPRARYPFVVARGNARSLPNLMPLGCYGYYG